jgi:nucleotide-binding universal stress UspA family protein
MFERILIPLDGSPRAELVLSQVARVLQREEAEILLLRVVDVPLTIGRADLHLIRRLELENAQTYLHGLAQRFRESGAKTHARVAEGFPEEVILEVARQEGATLIAMTTHGRTGLARWALGSVAEKVTRAADVPVLLVRAFRRTPTGDLEPASPQERPYKRILVPVDGGPTAACAVTPAEKLAQLYGSEILVLHVRPLYVPPGGLLPGMEAMLPLMTAQPILPGEDEATENAADRFRHAGLPVRRMTVEGDPASLILDVAASENVDLIAMGTHGRSGVRRWALGSVAERVLRAAEVPVLLARDPAARRPSVPQPAQAGLEVSIPLPLA